MNKPAFLQLWSLSVGAMDAVTGLLLIFAPVFTIRLMGIAPLSDGAIVFVGWIGVFVMSIGLSYGLALIRGKDGEAVWIFTSLVRIAVAVFVTVRVMGGALEARWLLVGATDLFVAVVQIFIVLAGWWKEGQTCDR